MEPFRWMHATRVRLDSPVILPGELTEGERQLAEDATIRGFRLLVEACVSDAVDLLLLTGDTFESSVVTLREQMELEQGLQKLVDHGIAVVIVPGPEDPARAWQSHLQVPAGVSLLTDISSDPVRIRRGGQELAVVFPVALVDERGIPRGLGDRDCPASQGGIRIGVVGAGVFETDDFIEDMESISPTTIQMTACPSGAIPPDDVERSLRRVVQQGEIDYLAVGIGERRTTRRVRSSLLHDPGPLQGMERHAIGPCGASLVTVGHERRLEIEPVPCSLIRWEQVSLESSAASSLEDVIDLMQSRWQELAPERHEELWNIHWTIRLPARLSEELRREAGQGLWTRIESSGSRRPACRHQLRIHELSQGEESDQELGSLHREVGSLAEQHLRSDLRQMVEELTEGSWAKTPWGRRITREIGKLNPARLVARVSEAAGRALKNGERESAAGSFRGSAAGKGAR